jgi:hypothetical protein
VDRLNEAVQHDAAKLVERFSELTFIDDWIDDSEALDESWDWILDNDEADEADLSEICLFDTLDRFSLACHASHKLLPEGAEVPEDLRTLIEEVAEGENFLRDHPELFLGAAQIASANLARYRPDLDEVDELLWETTLKHRVLEELLEERDAEPAQRLTQQEMDELLQVARTIEPPPLQEERPAEILVGFFGEEESTNGTRRAAAAIGRNDSLHEKQLERANRRAPVEDDPAVQVALVLEIDDHGRWNGLDISLFGRQEAVDRYDKAVLSSESMRDPCVVDLTSGVGTFFFDDDIGAEDLLRSGTLKISLRDRHNSREHSVLLR